MEAFQKLFLTVWGLIALVAFKIHYKQAHKLLFSVGHFAKNYTQEFLIFFY